MKKAPSLKNWFTQEELSSFYTKEKVFILVENHAYHIRFSKGCNEYILEHFYTSKTKFTKKSCYKACNADEWKAFHTWAIDNAFKKTAVKEMIGRA